MFSRYTVVGVSFKDANVRIFEDKSFQSFLRVDILFSLGGFFENDLCPLYPLKNTFWFPYNGHIVR